jgi:hypothetical protein
MVTVSNLRRLERLEERAAVTDTEYENFMGSLLEARMKAAVLLIKLMDRGLEETERADLEARLKKAKDFTKELEAHRPTSRTIRSGEFVMSADMETVLEERRRKREEAEKEYNARVLAGYGSGN